MTYSHSAGRFWERELFCTQTARLSPHRRQRSEARGQRPEVGGQRSAVRGQKRSGVIDHAAEHFADFGIECAEFAVLLGSDVATSSGKVQRGVGFVVFAVAISQPFDRLRTGLLVKCASYRRFAQASRRFRHTDRDERRIWPVRRNNASAAAPPTISQPANTGCRCNLSC